VSRWDPDPDEVRDVRPYDFASAKRAIAHQSREQARAETTLRDAHKELAEKERVYRVELAKEMVRLKSEGTAATVCQDLARGNERIAQLRYERDVQEGVKEAAAQALWKLAANRRELEQLVDWSMRVGAEAHPDEVAA
jgi:hypothetical protein